MTDRGEAPTRKEIAEAFSYSSPNAAQEHVRALERKGHITLIGGARGIRVNKRTSLIEGKQA
jgi:repressor LexA